MIFFMFMFFCEILLLQSKSDKTNETLYGDLWSSQISKTATSIRDHGRNKLFLAFPTRFLLLLVLIIVALTHILDSFEIFLFSLILYINYTVTTKRTVSQ